MQKSYRERLLESQEKNYLSGKVCPYCNKDTELIDSAEIYGGKSYGLMYICRDCNAYVGCYRDTDKALGRLADFQLRDFKHRAHLHFDKIWQENPSIGRRDAYRWLAQQMDIPVELTHIGMFEVDMCQKVIELSEEYLKVI